MDARARLIRAALGFLSVEAREPEPRLLHRCSDTWHGIGGGVAGMARQEDDLELRRYNGRAGARCSSLVVLSTRSRHLLAPRGRGALGKRCSAAADTLRRREGLEPAPRHWTLIEESPR